MIELAFYSYMLLIELIDYEANLVGKAESKHTPTGKNILYVLWCLHRHLVPCREINWKARPFTLLLLERSHALKNDSTDLRKSNLKNFN